MGATTTLDLNPTEKRLLRAFLRTVAIAEPLLDELADRYALSLGDFRAVRLLAKLGAVPVSRFGGELGVPRSTITNLVDRLERAGVVARIPDPVDRRVTLVELTDTGRQAVEAINLVRESEMVQRLFSLDETSKTRLAELLERVADAPSVGGKGTETNA